MKGRLFFYTVMIIIIITSCSKHSSVNLRYSIINDALKCKGAPYKYGGTTIKGFDCSGFVQYVYAKNGINLPRTVSSIETVLRKTKSPLKGDLVIFGNPKHIGIYLGKNIFIHASSSRGIVTDDIRKEWYKKRFKGFFTYF